MISTAKSANVGFRQIVKLFENSEI